MRLLAAEFDPFQRKMVRYWDRTRILQNYAGRPDVFGTFTDVLPHPDPTREETPIQAIPKLGINPSTKYNTPIGIYCYPVDYIISKFEEGSAIFGVPFPPEASSKFLQLFQVKDMSRVLQLSKEEG